MTATLTQASHQWATRPADERFTSLHDMSAALNTIRARSAAKVVASVKIEAQPASNDDIKALQIVGPNGHAYSPTHWSFGQIAALAGAPAGYLRTLPAAIAADAINYGMRFNRDVEDVGVLLRRTLTAAPDMASPDTHEYSITAATGPNYGRVWNADIADALVSRFGDGVSGHWRVPGEFGVKVPVTNANTTLYASDRDMFVFLADEEHRITVDNRRNGQSGSLARGFFAWNSEVGSTSIGAAFFLFDYACKNRIVWGAEQYKEIRLRHTVSAPDKWLGQIEPVLIEYANSEAATVEKTIAAAQARKLDDAKAFLAKRFTIRQAAQYDTAHMRDEGRPIETLWDAVTGMTAFARTIEHQDQRVALEREAGKLLAMAD